MNGHRLAIPGPVRVEHLDRLCGIGLSAPRLSWEPTGTEVTGYELESTSQAGGKWTVRCSPDAYTLVPWLGAPLTSREGRHLRVRALLGGEAGPWSEVTYVEAGLLEKDEWSAQLVVCDQETIAAPVLRRRFTMPAYATWARLHVTFHGIGQVFINGAPVTDEVLAPGWHSYSNRLVVRTHDVTSFLVPGENDLEVRLGDGWYRGRLGFFEDRAVYGTELGVIAQLEAVVDGELVTITSDEAWEWRDSAVRSSDLYDGETYDARLDVSGEHVWQQVALRPFDLSKLEHSVAPPVRRTQTIAAQRIFRSPSGKVLVDFGQNLVGWVRLKVEGAAGTEITLRHAEVLEQDELGVRPLRTARATDRYILSGRGLETWEPSFTFHGFRYVEVEGWPGGEPQLRDLEAVVVHTDMRLTGGFSTSHAGLDKLHRNVVWSMRGNFVSLPTDCPQRNERLGWTGDIAVFAPTATYLYDCTGLLLSWLADVSAEQSADGLIPYFVPSVPFPAALQDNPLFRNSPTAVWGDACTMVPTALYQATGDARILVDALPTMILWVDLVRSLTGQDLVWDTGFQYGDWLDPTAPVDAPERGATEPSLIATAYFAHSAFLTGEAAHLAGDIETARKYRDLAEHIRLAFRRRFLLPEGRLTSHSQTAYSVALSLRLFDKQERPLAGAHLVALVRENDYRIRTGFVGTPLVLGALTEVGAADDAYKLALQTGLPSWLYAVGMGATTIWERWDSMLPDGSINPGEMTSFNHYALGAVASWLHETVGGLAADEPGYQRIRIAPRPNSEVRDASTWHHTPHGRASVDWQLDGEELSLSVTVPPGTSAYIDVPGIDKLELSPGNHNMVLPYVLDSAVGTAPFTHTPGELANSVTSGPPG